MIKNISPALAAKPQGGVGRAKPRINMVAILFLFVYNYLSDK